MRLSAMFILCCLLPAIGGTAQEFDPIAVDILEDGKSRCVKDGAIFDTPNPIYPKAAAEQRLEGWVTVQFDVLRTGDVDQIVIMESEPRGIFDEAAIVALAKRHYPPEQLNNGSCNQLVEVFVFTLGE